MISERTLEEVRQQAEGNAFARFLRDLPIFANADLIRMLETEPYNRAYRDALLTEIDTRMRHPMVTALIEVIRRLENPA